LNSPLFVEFLTERPRGSVGSSSRDAHDGGMASDPDDDFAAFVDDVLDPDIEIEEPAPQARPSVKTIPVVTSPMFLSEGRRMVRTLPAVSSVRCFGTGLLQDASLAVRDVVGGRAGRVESALEKLIAQVRREVGQSAAATGAHAVVSFHVEFGQLGKSAVFAIGSGTPVVLSDAAS
jgi:uncharacterized protein YbjQ (UPF0145 family)